MSKYSIHLRSLTIAKILAIRTTILNFSICCSSSQRFISRFTRQYFATPYKSVDSLTFLKGSKLFSSLTSLLNLSTSLVSFFTLLSSVIFLAALKYLFFFYFSSFGKSSWRRRTSLYIIFWMQKGLRMSS